MAKKTFNIQNMLIFLSGVSFISMFLTTGYLSFVINTINYLLFSNDIIFIFSFLFTFIYQIGIQLIKTNEKKFYSFMYLLFILSLFIPLFAASQANNRELVLQYISYIVLNITSIPPIVAALLLFSKEVGYKNPLKLIMLFSIALINTLILEVAKNLEMNSLGSFQLNKLGVYELNVFLSYYQAIVSSIFGLNVSDQTLQIILNIQNYSYYYIIPIVLVISFIYVLLIIIDNKRIYEDGLYYQNSLYNVEDERIYLYIAIISVISVSISIFLLTAIQYLSTNIDMSFSSLLLIVPFIISIAIFLAGKK